MTFEHPRWCENCMNFYPGKMVRLGDDNKCIDCGHYFPIIGCEQEDTMTPRKKVLRTTKNPHTYGIGVVGVDQRVLETGMQLIDNRDKAVKILERQLRNYWMPVVRAAEIEAVIAILKGERDHE